ncbi:type 1 glutamine amidotransferase [Pseudaestuariivita atlantica]|uniref:Glutamine amidotransferase n=1 Tax=Pseudaestuariivita atlantica TaxID=1317121 RepID=A0A0L1JU94_9RHOB|nr:type 1 glutamine amidotransferase [Pseudaestuariivita atlantica]KNG95336.1 glutamine amidotransferase [Pseudaestuariivita atlantica]
MHIGILVAGHAPEPLVPEYGTYHDMFARFLDGHGLTFTGYTTVDGELPGSVHDADGWLITGSKHGVYEYHAFIPPLEDFIRDAHAARVPMVGICFGHQIIARALGARVEKFAGGWRVGPTVYDTPDGPLELNAYHQDQVLTVPEGASVIASNPGCAIAGLQYGDWGWSIQPHPEFPDAFVSGLIASRGRGVVPDDILDIAEARLDGQNDNARVADRIAQFFHASKARAA